MEFTWNMKHVKRILTTELIWTKKYAPVQIILVVTMRKVCLCLCFCVFCLCLCLSDHQTLMCYDSELRSVLKFKFKFTCAKLAWPPILVVTMEKVCQDQRWRIETIAAAWCGSFMSIFQYCNIAMCQYCLTWSFYVRRCHFNIGGSIL